jgi:hypothetical protein
VEGNGVGGTDKSKGWNSGRNMLDRDEEEKRKGWLR